METPASISNSAAAATLIQRAFRGAQKRIAAEQAELAHVLNALEEADEARINARESVMTQVNKKLEDFIANVGSSLRGGGETALSKSALHAKSLQKKELPSLTVGSLHNFVAGLENDERVAMVDALAILQAATVMFMSEPSVCDITVPSGGKCTIVGDLHGQLVRRQRARRRKRRDERCVALLLFSLDDARGFFFGFFVAASSPGARRSAAGDTPSSRPSRPSPLLTLITRERHGGRRVTSLTYLFFCPSCHAYCSSVEKTRTRVFAFRTTCCTCFGNWACLRPKTCTCSTATWLTAGTTRARSCF
jgi:hypothetical protein